MIPRNRLDIGWADLAVAFGRCFWPGDRDALTRRVEGVWCEEGRAVACLSVRSGFDLLLRALRMEPGSEVLLSAVTIRDMVRIIREHGLLPVPVDVDMTTLEVDLQVLERAITPRTRVLVVAHLFGSRQPMAPLVAVCRRHGLVLVEDCAQAYVGNVYRGDPAADISMFSFGPIKTNTALGGGLLRFRDPHLEERVRRLQLSLPVQPRAEFLLRVLKYATIRALLLPPVFGLFALACRAMGTSHDQVISGAVRGFPSSDFFARIRRRPSYPLLALLLRRLVRFRRSRLAARVASARAAIRALNGTPRAGSGARRHTHWVFPIRADSPDLLVRRLWRAGLDATRGASSLHVVEPPTDRPELAAVRAEGAMAEILYLPVHPGLSAGGLRRLARELDAARAP